MLLKKHVGTLCSTEKKALKKKKISIILYGQKIPNGIFWIQKNPQIKF